MSAPAEKPDTDPQGNMDIRAELESLVRQAIKFAEQAEARFDLSAAIAALREARLCLNILKELD
jgi:hypothetical protein